MKNRFVELSI